MYDRVHIGTKSMEIEDDEFYSLGEMNEELEHDSPEVNDDTQDPNDNEYLDLSDKEHLDLSVGENEVESGNIPVLGMSFESDEAAYDYYNEYARYVGFSVQKQRSNKYRHTNVI
ncbi:hypothetical protein ACLB2K_048504 [Fragaria x ananassa]